MAEPLIDLLGGLKKAALGVKGSKNGRMTIELTAPELVFSADEDMIAGDVAKAIEATMRENLEAGRDGNGVPFPAPSPATLERRSYRMEQANRGGALSPRIKDKKMASAGRRSYFRRFRAAALGYMRPEAYADKFGRESGMLAKSPKAVAKGGVWTIYFAVIRARVDRSGESAVGRVFKGRSVWGDRAMRQERIQSSLRSLARGLLAHRAAKILAELAKAQRNAAALAEASETEG